MCPSVQDPPGAALIDVGAFAWLGGAERDRAFMAVEREIRRLQGLQATLAAEVLVSESYRDDMHSSAVSWAQAVLNNRRGSAHHLIAVAELCQRFEVVGEAMRTGQLGADQVRALVALHANPRARAHLGEVIAELVGYATTLRLREFQQCCQRWLAYTDPDGTLRDHERARSGRFVKITKSGGRTIFHVEGDSVTGEILANVLEAHAQAELHQDLADRQAEHGELAEFFSLPRTAAQRRYDALVGIFDKAAGTNVGSKREPLVNLICTPAELQAIIRAEVGGLAEPAGLQPSLRSRLCETVDGTPVDPRDMLVAALCGQVRRVVVDELGRVIDLGRRSRLFRGAAREAVLLTGNICVVPGCELRVPDLQIDHAVPWIRAGGDTNPSNGSAMCAKHNRGKHAGRFTCLLDSTGWHYFRPDGSEIAPVNADC